MPRLDDLALSLARELAARPVSVVLSSRLTRSLARCSPGRREIRLNVALERAPARLQREVLVHELAHIAVFEKHGRAARPHGPEWQAIVRATGFEPTTRITTDELEPTRRPSRSAAKTYVHTCPVCGMVRTAKRPVPRWRCAACVAAGLDGLLEIISRPTKGGAK